MDPALANVVVAIGRQTPGGVELLGTSFAVGKNKLATTAHCLNQSDKDLVLVLPRITNINDYQDTSNVQINTVPVKIYAYDPIRDLAILETHDAEFMYHYTIGGSDNLSAGQEIYSLGFPHADLGRLVLTQQVSTVGARIIMNAKNIMSKHIVMNVQARPGSSGSPVFNKSANRIEAVLIGSYVPNIDNGGIRLGNIDPYTLHQTTHAVSAEYITGML